MNTMKQYNLEELYQGVLQNHRRMLAKAISLVESSRIEDFLTAQKLIEMLLPYTGKSYRIGFTGVPGVGKSSFIESWGQYIVEQGRKIAILAIDPSSQRSGGSILGDKTRMLELSRRNVFIRPLFWWNSRWRYPKTRNYLLCEATGFDTFS